ncbi:MAG: hypothetical protein ABW360_05940 [Phenylobacterium sp.]
MPALPFGGKQGSMKPPADPRVTDLRRYKKAREQARRRPPPRPPSQSFLGSRPRAGLILAAVVLALVALTVLQVL